MTTCSTRIFVQNKPRTLPKQFQNKVSKERVGPSKPGPGEIARIVDVEALMHEIRACATVVSRSRLGHNGHSHILIL